MPPVGNSAKSNSVGVDKQQPKVFLSYSRRDADVARKLKAALEATGIQVYFDLESIGAGEDIRDFIVRAIRDTDLTLCLISDNSLNSSWVAAETTLSFYEEKRQRKRRFIACSISDEFFNDDYRVTVTTKIDSRLARLAELTSERHEHKLDTVDLDDEKARLFALRQDLGHFLKRLKSSETVDIAGAAFDDGVAKIVRAVK